jgi:hypothetical protein
MWVAIILSSLPSPLSFSLHSTPPPPSHLLTSGIELLLNTCVSGVENGYVITKDKAGNTSKVPFGACVWATGLAMNPLLRQLQQLLPGQTHPRCLLTDGHMAVKGSRGSMFALGDAATIEVATAAAHADEMFDWVKREKVSWLGWWCGGGEGEVKGGEAGVQSAESWIGGKLKQSMRLPGWSCARNPRQISA